MVLSENKLKKISISISIVFYNSSEKDVKKVLSTLKKLNSLSKFTFSFFLIDNASTPKLHLDLENLQMQNVYIKRLEVNNGFGAGHNAVLGDLNSDFHIIMNPDIDIEDLDGFVKAVYYMQEHKNIVMLSPLVRNETDGDIQYLNRKLPTVFDLFIRFLGPNILVDYRMKLATQLVVNKKRHSA